MIDIYQANLAGDAVVRQDPGDNNATYAIHPEAFPLSPWQVAHSMNAAYERGYAQAQADIRKALGMK